MDLLYYTTTINTLAMLLPHPRVRGFLFFSEFTVYLLIYSQREGCGTCAATICGTVCDKIRFRVYTRVLYKHKHGPLGIIAKSMSEIDRKAAPEKQRKLLAAKLVGADQYGLRRQMRTNTPITLGDLPGGYDSQSFESRPISPIGKYKYKERMYATSRYIDVTNDVPGRRHPAKQTFSCSSCPAMRAQLDAISMHVLEKSLALHARHEQMNTNTLVGNHADMGDSNDGDAKTSKPERRDVKPTVAEQGSDSSECESEALSPDDENEAGVVIPSLPVRTHAQ